MQTVSYITHHHPSLSVTEGFELSNKLSFWYGTPNLGDNPDLFKAQVTRLAAAVDARLAGDSNAASSGCIINTGGWIDGGGYERALSLFVLHLDLVPILTVRLQHTHTPPP